MPAVTDSLQKIAFIGGGNMAQALIRGLLRTKRVRAEQVVMSDPQNDVREYCQKTYNVQTYDSNLVAASNAEVIILAVKPQTLSIVLHELQGNPERDALFISLAAGKRLAHIEQRLWPHCRVVRSMPNVCSLVGEGATAISAGNHATERDLDIAKAVFDSVGKTFTIDESLMDAVTGLSGSGPAFVFMMIEALSDAGVKTGLSHATAYQLACQTLLGSAKLAVETKQHPSRLREMVCSPGGTAIAAVHFLEKAGFRSSIVNAVEVATARSQELGAEDSAS